jgi:hypothetical protein
MAKTNIFIDGTQAGQTLKQIDEELEHEKSHSEENSESIEDEEGYTG